ncbi:hypothetical protein Tco_1223578 [Tanacetum coccineum]
MGVSVDHLSARLKLEIVSSLAQRSSTEKIIQIKSRIQAARDRQKSYADVRQKPFEFQVGDKIIAKVGTIAYRLELPEQLSRVHSTFHVSNLKKCISDETLAIPLDEIQIDDKLYFIKEPVKIMDREVKLLKQSRILMVKEDANLKLLRSLPSAWNNIALIMRNKSDLDTLSMDDLYNNMKVYEYEIKGQLSSNSQNVAFVSLENTSSTNEVVNTAYEVSTASSQGQASSLTYADDVMFSFFANQSNSLQLDNEYLKQIDTADLE